ncbi:MAG: DMT family transporter [Gammaproteobacteria bacterium]|nr:DMT family transporter [Gammaproteobacteria bacterium]
MKNNANDIAMTSSSKIAKPAAFSAPAAHLPYPALSMLLGVIMWGIAWYPMRLLEARGLHGLWLAMTLYLSALIISLPYTLPAWRAFMRHPLLLILLTLSIGWTNVAYIQAMLDGNILRVSLLVYLSPLWASVLAWLLLKERLGRVAIASLGLAMLGALVMLWNPALGAPWPRSHAEWMALSSGLTYAVATVVMRKGQDVPQSTKLLCTCIGVPLIASAMIVYSALPWSTVALPVLAGAAALGIGGILVMTLLVQYGITHLPVHRSQVLALMELVTGAITQRLLTDEVMTTQDWIGGTLIVFGAYVASRKVATRST